MLNLYTHYMSGTIGVYVVWKSLKDCTMYDYNSYCGFTMNLSDKEASLMSFCYVDFLDSSFLFDDLGRNTFAEYLMEYHTPNSIKYSAQKRINIPKITRVLKPKCPFMGGEKNRFHFLNWELKYADVWKFVWKLLTVI